MTREVKQWFDQIDNNIWDPMSNIDWGMFRSSSSDVGKFRDVVKGEILS